MKVVWLRQPTAALAAGRSAETATSTVRSSSRPAADMRGRLLLALAAGCYLIAPLACSQQAPGSLFRGESIGCYNEGQEVIIPRISEDPCISCHCQKQEVVCKHESCPNAPNCYFLLFGKKRSCCDSCKGCELDGKHFTNGDEWTDNKDPCKKYKCQSGVLTISSVQCHVLCRNPSPPGPNECCPKCSSCMEGGVIYNNGDHVPIKHPDSCVQCFCKDGFITCSKLACPVLPCPPSRFSQQPGQCCPQCKGVKKGYESAGLCSFGDQTLSHGHRLAYDYCTKCVCNGTTAVCDRQSCPPLECPAQLQVQQPEVCCPRCRGQQELEAVCRFKGKIFQNGESWKLDRCSKCDCLAGKVHCETEDCSRNPPCPPRFQLKVLPGECCPTCVEDNPVCAVFGDPHYRTFDGDIFHFQGTCRYMLTRDCEANTFSIQVINEPRYSKANPWTRAISMKIGSVKVHLSQHLKVRVGRKKVRLPYISLGVLSIQQENDTVIVRANIGVKLLWDGNSYVEVSVTTAYKKKLCGLCGNYNSDPKDDYKTRKGVLTKDPNEFAQSWQTGKKKNCPKPNVAGSNCRQNWESRNKARRDCGVFKLPAFQNCHQAVAPAPYLHSCMLDMCDCKTGEKCFCESLKAYVRECDRAGVAIPNWKQLGGCNGTKCPKGATVSPCGASCRKTCKNHNQPVCHRKCQAGCECLPGTVWHRQRCIPVLSCPVT